MNKYFNAHTTILVTGASSGIGKKLSELLITKYGAKVIGVGRSEEKLNKVKALLGDNFTPIIADVQEDSEWQKLKTYIESNGLTLGGIINCAGVLPEFSAFTPKYFEENESVIKTNYLSVIYSAKYFLDSLQSLDRAVLVNISSSSSLCPFAGISLYSSTKAAVERFSECLAYENKRVKVVTVMPGFTKTDVLRSQNFSGKEKGLIDKISANPQRVARKILRKASRGKKRVITGFDAHLMNFLFKFFPRTAPRLIGWFLRKTKMKIFEKI